MKFNININEKIRKKTKLISKITATVFTGIFNVSMFAGAIMLENADAINSVLNLETQIHVDDPTNNEWIPYDHEMWDDLLDQITWDEYVNLLTRGLRKTVGVPSINKPETIDHNGATGVVQNYNISEGTGVNNGLAVRTKDKDRTQKPIIYPCNGIAAATFNPELANFYGRQWGEDGLWAGHAGLYGMGINTHRSPYGGRNFEYYSEDPVLGGKIAAEMTKGMSTRGMYVYLKHCFMNDQESYRCGLFTWANEQTAREIYLKPFQIAIEEGRAQCVMGGLNSLGVMWCNQQGFMNTVLRGEFGMTGHVVTDSLSYHNGNFSQSLLYGTEIPDGTYNGDMDFAKPAANGKGAYAEYAWAMREAAHRILYTTVHSNAMNSFSASTKLIFVTPWWQHAVIALETVTGLCLGLSLVAWGGVVFLDFKDKRDKQKLAKGGTENEEVV